MKWKKKILTNNFLEFNGQVKQQMSGTASGTKSAPAYACIVMDDVESKFLKLNHCNPIDVLLMDLIKNSYHSWI